MKCEYIFHRKANPDKPAAALGPSIGDICTHTGRVCLIDDEADRAKCLRRKWVNDYYAKHPNISRPTGHEDHV